MDESFDPHSIWTLVWNFVDIQATKTWFKEALPDPNDIIAWFGRHTPGIVKLFVLATCMMLIVKSLCHLVNDLSEVVKNVIKVSLEIILKMCVLWLASKFLLVLTINASVDLQQFVWTNCANKLYENHPVCALYEVYLAQLQELANILL